jgi:methylamine---glutamate N-methyltransferase subunit C
MTNVADTPENFKKCICLGCPTYQADECVKKSGEKLFCAKGKSKRELASKGCICGACPVWSESKLTSYYYCKK